MARLITFNKTMNNLLIIYIPVDEECWHCPFRTDNAIGDRGP